ncbi:MAG TPA: AAA family ATPase [Enhygromyxa sp.]|nr:AAA family ATPase [Enhygromyxa sp.]
MMDRDEPPPPNHAPEYIGRFGVLGKLGEGGMGVVFLAHDGELDRRVAIKLMRSSVARSIGVRRLLREAQGLARLSHPNVIQVHEIGEHQRSLFVAMEYVEGITLRSWLDAGPRPWRETLNILRQAGRGLEAAHLAGLVHRDFKPGNIMVGKDGRARVLDFGLARDSRPSADAAASIEAPAELRELETTLVDADSHVDGSLTRSGALMGTPGYMAPEQLHGNPCNPLSDQFSFCVTAYEALFGRRPFAGATLHELTANVERGTIEPIPSEHPAPERVKQAVLRGLAPEPGARWPTMAALLDELDAIVAMAELQAHLERLRAGESQESLELVRPEKFSIPEQLYGREPQLAALREAFERTRDPSTSQLLLVTGLAGIGKSSLVEGFRPTVVAAGGWMFAGKFEQRSAVPLGGIVEALSDLVAQIEREDLTTQAHLRSTLVEAIGRNARLLCEFVPAIARLLGGRAASVEPLEPRDRRRLAEQIASAQSSVEWLNPLHLATARLVTALASAARPLVMVVDDLHWADAASLALLEHLLTRRDVQGFLVVGTCRTNEVGPDHPLRATLDKIRGAGAMVSSIDLEALSLADVEALLGDTLNCEAPAARELAELALAKTEGNPFYLRQLLRTMHDQGLFAFELERRRWTWDLDRIAASAAFDDIREILLRNLESLPPACSSLVRIAACIGHRFELLLLAAVVERDPVEVFADLRPAFEHGLLLIEGGLLDNTTLGESTEAAIRVAGLLLRFRHSRIQQAASSSLAEPERMRAHVQIGRALQRRHGGDDQAARSFEIADQLNAGRTLLDEPEREALIELDLECGRRALESGAHANALHYLEIAAELLPRDEQARRRHPLWFAIELERARALSLDGRYAEADGCFQALLELAESDVERVLVNTAQVEHALLSADFEPGYAACRRGFTLQGIELPARDEDAHAMFVAELDAIERNLAGRSPAGLIDLPQSGDAMVYPSPKLLHGLGSLSYLSGRPNINGWIIARMVNLSLRSGNSKVSSLAYARIAMHLAERGEYERAREFGELGMASSARHEDPTFTGRAYIAYLGHSAYYQHPLIELVPRFAIGFDKALEGGDISYAGYNLLYPQSYRLIAGVRLPTIMAEIEAHVPFLRRSVPNLLTAFYVPHVVHTTCTLMDVPLASLELAFDPTTHRASFGGSTHAMGWYESVAIKLDYLLGAAIDTDELRRRVAAVELGLPGNLQIREARYYAMLSLLATLGERALPQIASWRADLARCAGQCPANFRHKHLLVEAELSHASNGPLEQTIDHYEGAIEAAQQHGAIDQEALACWRFAKLWRARGNKRTARVYLAAARELYEAWGARRLVRALDEQETTWG